MPPSFGFIAISPVCRSQSDFHQSNRPCVFGKIIYRRGRESRLRANYRSARNQAAGKSRWQDGDSCV